MQAFEVGHLRAYPASTKVSKPPLISSTKLPHKTTCPPNRSVSHSSRKQVSMTPAADADRRGVAQPEIMGVARGVPVDRDQARPTAAALVFQAHVVAGPLHDHQHVEIGALPAG